MPALAKFEEFLLRAVKPAATALPLRRRSSSSGAGGASSQPVSAPAESAPGVVLVDDPPNVVERTRSQFHACLRRYLATTHAVRSVVLIVSELFASETNVLGPLPTDITTSPRCTAIHFNPVANTLLTKALERVVDGELRARRLRVRPTAEQLKDVVANSAGDVRNAVNSLHILLLDPRGTSAGRTSHAAVAPALPGQLLGKFAGLLDHSTLLLDVDDASLAGHPVLRYGRDPSTAISCMASRSTRRTHP